MKSNKIILALGSNVGDREKYIFNSIYILVNEGIIKNVQLSRIINTKAILPDDAPNNWDKDFLNCIIAAETYLLPNALLESINGVERRCGRTYMGVWSPREIDIDILFFGDICIQEKHLTIPHKEILNREFLLTLLNEMVPHFVFPGKGRFHNKTIKQICEEL